MTSQVNLQRPSSDAVPDEVAGRMDYPDPTVLWTGSARVQRLTHRASGGETNVGGRFLEVQLYQVSLPADAAEPQINDQVAVTANPDDPSLVGKLLHIREVRFGSLLWSRDVICEEVTPTTR